MRNIPLALLLAAAVAVSLVEGVHLAADAKVEIPPEQLNQMRNITQKVDHFNPQCGEMFWQRYIARGEHFNSGGPLIILVGEQNYYYYLNPYGVEDTLALDIARETGGYFLALEPRYFGYSHPVRNLSTANLRYLTIDQSLADIAHFIVHLKRSVVGAKHSTVILVGQRFGGTLAVWFRQKYPHLAQGVWASSAATHAQLNHVEYMQAASGTLMRLAGHECYATVAAGFAEFQEMARAQRLMELGALVNVCEANQLRTRADVALMFSELAGMFTSRPSVPSVCAMLLDKTHPTAGAAVASVIRHFSEPPGCLAIDYNAFIATGSVVDLSTPAALSGLRATTYQMCTQLGWFRTSDSADQPFGSMFPLAFFAQICAELFGVDVASAGRVEMDRTNVVHGGLRPMVRNVLFTNGADDPSRSLSVQADLNEAATVVTIPDGGSSYDFWRLNESDAAELQAIKRHIVLAVKSWV